MSPLRLPTPSGSKAPFPGSAMTPHHEQAPAFVGWSTYPSAETAQMAARTLVDERIVACAQVSGPIQSYYRADGKTVEATEWRLTLKFTTEYLDLVPRRLKDTHPYSIPQWMTVRIDLISPDYLAWMNGY